MKKIITGLLVFLLFVLLCGCGHQMSKMPNEQAATRFSIVDAYGNFQIIVDGDTVVMYSISESGTLTLLVNYDGSPRTFPSFDAKEDRTP